MAEPIPTPDTKLTGTLVVSVETVTATGTLFPLLALMLRSAGMQVLVVGRGANQVEKKAADLNLPFTDFKETMLVGKLFQDWKFGVATRALRSGPVIWADMDFSQWAGPDCNGIPGLTVVNIGALLQQGIAPVSAVPV